MCRMNWPLYCQHIRETILKARKSFLKRKKFLRLHALFNIYTRSKLELNTPMYYEYYILDIIVYVLR